MLVFASALPPGESLFALLDLIGRKDLLWRLLQISRNCAAAEPGLLE